jgi:uncharacterized protein
MPCPRVDATVRAMDLATVLGPLQAFFPMREDVVAAYLFGSVARGTAGPRSDVDIGILLASGQPKDLGAIGAVTSMHDELGALLRREVDLVVLNGASPDLLHRVLRDGVLLFERDHERRIEFEVQARNHYFDMLPTIDLYRRTVLGKL